MNPMTFLRLQWDRVGAWVCIAGGALALLLGYVGISGTPHVASQLPYVISGGIFGLFLLGLGGILWISADLRDEWRELRGIRDSLDRSSGGLAGAQTSSVPLFSPSTRDAAVEAEPAARNAAPARPRRARASAGGAK